jgi:hypothetical protein
MSGEGRDSRSARELLEELRGRGLTNAELAGEIRRDPKMIRKVLNGETSGEAYRTTLLEIARTGRATTVPPRRRSKSGDLVPVRSKRGASTPTVVPEDPGGRYTNRKQGGRLRTGTTYLGGGARIHELHVPKTKTARGRADADAAIVASIRAASKGQSGDNQKRVKATLTYANGRIMEVNDYNASTLLDRLNGAEGGALGWLADQSSKRYPNLDTGQVAITGVSLTVYETPKTEQYHSNQARRQRRGGAQTGGQA